MATSVTAGSYLETDSQKAPWEPHVGKLSGIIPGTKRNRAAEL